MRNVARNIAQMQAAIKADVEAGAYQPKDDIFDWIEYETTVEEMERLESWLRRTLGVTESGQMDLAAFA